MLNHIRTRAIVAGLWAFIVVTVGCGDGPAPSPTPVPAALSVTSISPNAGSTFGTTRAWIGGTGFQPGARVTIDGTVVNANVLSAGQITITMPAHGAGVVDISVTNPSGQSASLPRAYTYVEIPPPVISSVTPNAGSTGGGAPVMITGTGFQNGAVVSIDGAVSSTFVQNSTTIHVWTRSHSAGTVAVTVTNPDGQIGRLDDAYTYADPRSFDFNGDWEGSAYSSGSSEHVLFRLKIQDNVVVSVTCGTAVDVALSPAPPVSHVFSFTGTGGMSMTGVILAPTYAEGTINLAPCLSSGWDAVKR